MIGGRKIMLDNLLPHAMYNLLVSQTDIDFVCEIRLRLDKPIYYSINGHYKMLIFFSSNNENFKNCICQKSDIDFVMFKASKNSLYAFNDCLVNGYIPCNNGIRIGVVGEGVSENQSLTTIKNITSLCIRLPHQVLGCSNCLAPLIADFDSSLFLSKPGLGKTTLLRDFVRQLSNKGYNTLVLDDRFELSGTNNRMQYLDLGTCSDVVVGLPKTKVYANHLRTMRPDIVATDEVFGEAEVAAILDAKRCGVKVVASLHCDDLAQLAQSPEYKPLIHNVRYLIMIKGIGLIDYVYDRKLKKCIL